MAAAACTRGEPAAASSIAPVVDAGGEARSNVYRADYVGPAECASCHLARGAGWRAGLHASMNQRAGEGRILGDFSGATVEYAGGRARFDRDGGGPVMSLERNGAAARRFSITRTIGTRYLQEYVGVEMGVPDAVELRLPFGWWVRQRAWFHQQYYDSWYGPEYTAAGAPAVDAYTPDPSPWAARCAWCHNTYPFELRALRTLHEPPLGEGTEQYFELLADHRPSDAARQAVVRDNLLPVDELVTVGISCESCHLGGRDHAVLGREISFVPTSPDLRLRGDAPDLAGGRENNVLVNTICAQCHSTPSPRFANGAAARNSSEALELAAGACLAKIKCTDCHDPHTTGPGAGAPAAERHLAACAGCHPAQATREHARHDPGAASCLDCHMPKIVQGVSDYTRSHRISSPGDETMLAAGAPNACNLCHLDRSITWTLRELIAGWNVRVTSRRAWLPNYGGRLDTPMARVWLASDDAAIRGLAAAAVARAPRPIAEAELPRLIERLDDPVAHDRMRMLFAVEDLLGRRLARAEYDPTAAPAIRAAQAAALRERPPRP